MKCEFSSYCKMKSMKYWVILFGIILLFPIGTALARNEPIEEDVELDSTEPETIIYNVGVELISVGAIDRGTGSSNLIFWWTIVSDDIDFTKNPPPDDWDLTNGYLVDKTGENIDPHFYKVKIRGEFFNEIDFRNYPYDKLILAIHIEPYFPLTTERVEFRVNEEYSAINPDTVSVPGWTMGEPTFAAITTAYPWGNFTHFEAHFPVEGFPVGVFLKKLLPPIILGLFGFGTFFMSSRLLQNRIGVVVTCLVGSLFFHAIFLLGELPPLGYLTLADKMMISIYMIFAGAGVTILVHQHHLDRKEIAHEERDIQRQRGIDKTMMIITAVGVSVVFAALYLL